MAACFVSGLPLYQMGQSDFEMIADSMRQVFPNVTWWWGRLDGKRPIVALIGSESPIAITPGHWRRASASCGLKRTEVITFYQRRSDLQNCMQAIGH